MAYTTKNYSGKVSFPTDSEGPFHAIIYGDAVNVTIIYDPSKVPNSGFYQYFTYLGGDGGIIFGTGELSFGTDMDDSNSMGWPIIQFKDGQFNGISYFDSFIEEENSYDFSANGLYWQINDSGSKEVVASGTISKAATSEKEQPAAS